MDYDNVAVLGELSPDERVRSVRWSEGSPGSLKIAAVILCAGTLAALGYVGWRLVRHHMAAGDQGDSGATDMFETLAHEHALNRQEKQTLRGIANRLGLTEPAALFVRKSLLERELTSVPEAGRTTIEALMQKLFDATAGK